MRRFAKPLAFSLSCALLFGSLAFPVAAQQPSPTQPQSATPQQSTATQVTQQQQQQTAAQAATESQQTPVDRIKDEGMNRSQVMQTLSYLTNAIGPRLTNSPGMKRANEWTRDKMTEWGLQNARLEAWGPFGRGWTLRRFSVQVTEPQAFPLIAYPRAWSPGTSGLLNAPVVYLDAATEADLAKYKGKLKGAVVLSGEVRETKAAFDPMATRLDDKQLLELANAPLPSPRQPQFSLNPTPEQLQALPPAQRERLERFITAQKSSAARLQFIHDEGAALIVNPSRSGSGGTIFLESASVPQPFNTPADKRLSPWSKDAPRILPQIVIANEDFNRIARMIGFGQAVKMEVNLDVAFQDADLMGYNTIAEIPGTDLKDEVVMLGAHLDSWHSATGATDNAAGSAVVMEAARIIKALNLQPRRTIRVALWSGEEQGLFGSRAYVAEHFGSRAPSTPGTATPNTPAPLVTKPAYEKFSAYYNLDNGTGRIRGVYMQGNEGVRPLFRQWLVPFKEMGASVLTSANTSGTDHLSFDAIGLPGFQFIQDEIEYDTRTHHSNQDTFDRIQADDMKQASTIMAWFVYNTAMMDEGLPRKPARTQ
jgi:hypothetical protein